MKIVDNKRYGEFLKNKRVVLVGPGWHVKGTKQKKMIHSYDVVVRINMGICIPYKLRQDYGKRTDVLYCSLGEYFFRQNRLLHKNKLCKLDGKVKWIIGTGHHRKNALNSLINNGENFKILLSIVDRKIFNNIFLKFERKKISSGIVTIYDLLQHDISELYITGITFFSTKHMNKKQKTRRRPKHYYSHYSEKDPNTNLDWVGKHPHAEELDFFKQLYRKDKRIKVDSALLKIIT